MGYSTCMIIVKYGNVVLESPTKLVTEFDKKLVKFVDEMIETMKENNGVGLAAPQVNDSRRICVIDLEIPEGKILRRL